MYDRAIADAQAKAKICEIELKSLQMQEKLDLSEQKLKIDSQDDDILDESLDNVARDPTFLEIEQAKLQLAEPIMVDVNSPSTNKGIAVTIGDMGTFKPPVGPEISLAPDPRLAL